MEFKNFEPALPNPKNLIHALRDIGYSLETAMADIIDNSITANATNIQIYVHFDMENSYIAIIDNGSGMDVKELQQAMSLGSFDPLDERNKKDLGRFGLGLKTASFSQASILTVASKQYKELIARSWDLDHVAKTKKWEVGVFTAKQIETLPKIEMLSENGTLVLWEKLDRLVDTNSRRRPEDIFLDKIDATRVHLGLVFHRFLTGEAGLKKISISINGDPIAPFDPFEGAGKHFPEEKIGNIKIQAYQLPHHSKVSSEQYKRLEGKESYVKSQGFYVYRNGRLLIHGTWFGLAKQNESTKLARVKIDLPNSEDFIWSIDVKKSQATPPDAIRTELKRTIDRIMKSSTRVYKNRGAQISKRGYVPIWTEYHQHNKKSYRLNYENPTIAGLLTGLDEDSRKKVRDIFSIVESTLPIDSIYADLSTAPESMEQNNVTGEQLAQHAENFWELLSNMGNTFEEMSLRLKQTEPFSKFRDFCETFIENKKRH
ncbi:MAG: ATP-binding protein [Nitrospirae bacterium]|nr:ATP-binding protein [Nitrospirota bacterium]